MWGVGDVENHLDWEVSKSLFRVLADVELGVVHEKCDFVLFPLSQDVLDKVHEQFAVDSALVGLN